jgi:[ribosomal protein S18]-alanine N-acetyltransferase
MMTGEFPSSSSFSGTPVVCKLLSSTAGTLSEIDAVSNRPPWSKRVFEQEFQLDYAQIFGARLSGELVGFLVLETILDEGHIMNFGVLPQFRRRGVGRALLREVVSNLRDNGIPWATLEVRRNNVIAQDLYRSFAFESQGVRPRYYSDDGEDAIIMTASVLLADAQSPFIKGHVAHG